MTRKAKQYRYLHGVVYPPFIPVFHMFTGYESVKTTDDVHTILTTLFRAGKTSEMTDDERADYIMQIKVFAVEKFGLHIPEPNEQENYFLKIN